MGVYLNWGISDHKDNDYTQTELRTKLTGSPADLVFFALMGERLLPFVGHIKQIFLPPRSEGVHFKFAPGKQKEFAWLIDPTRHLGKIGPMLFTKPGSSPLIPDDPGALKPAQLWRKTASLKGIGASFRQEGIQSSLHVAFDDDYCDVHVDRAGYMKKDAMGRVSWDHNGLLRHLFIDLASDFRDKVPLPLVSMGVTGANDRPIIKATLSPWLAVDLPSKLNGNKWSMTVGMALSGTFSLWDGS